jgi:hypothetical protein
MELDESLYGSVGIGHHQASMKPGRVKLTGGLVHASIRAATTVVGSLGRGPIQQYKRGSFFSTSSRLIRWFELIVITIHHC